MNVQPYLYFRGRCEEAVEFYKTVLGARDIELMRFSQSPEPVPAEMLPPGYDSKIMHGSFWVGDLNILVSDGMNDAAIEPERFALAITVDTESDVDRIFSGLADGGKVSMPPEKTFWSPRFGALTDRFGISWMVMAAA